MNIEWRGRGIDEEGVNTRTARPVVRIDPRYFRPAEVDSLLGDASKARDALGWVPQIDFDTLIREMVAADLELARRDSIILREGFKACQYRE
jgi:GDPmannose 4,6-dehydratase